MLKSHLQYQTDPTTQNEELFFAGRSLQKFTQSYSGPAFVYSLDLVQNRFETMQSAWPDLQIHFAMKANPHPKILQRLKKLGAHVDVVSGGELRRALESGMQPQDIIFSGVAKTKNEIRLAIETGIRQINVESLPELERILEISNQLQKKINIALRLNPDIEIKTHKYIATGLVEYKFGLEPMLIPEILKLLKKSQYVSLAGVSVHLGSQMLDFSGLKDALVKVKKYFRELQAAAPTCMRFDFGGGLGISYDEVNPSKEFESFQVYLQTVKSELADLKNCEIQTEPGRWLVAHAGILLCQVQYIKTNSQKTFMIVDSGMNHLLRPSLYEAYHWMGPVILKKTELQKVDVVGPICESSDFFAKDRSLPIMQQDDFLVIADCGAYGASMSSDYNLHDRATELFID